MAFRFRVVTDNWRMEDGQPIRDVEDMEVDEVSVVTFPAYPATDVSLSDRTIRSLENFHAEHFHRSVAFREKELRLMTF
jgi:phage head maturation protease